MYYVIVSESGKYVFVSTKSLLRHRQVGSSGTLEGAGELVSKQVALGARASLSKAREALEAWRKHATENS
jgi:hypothetical protein